MEDEFVSAAPKPFIFVLMPFDPAFNDTYKFGIKGAAADVGAYAERVDEQIFTEGILDRIFNQIAKADVIAADMTGRNPNVFYEVGYAHALGKVVLLLTRDADDIPFDLKHRQHIVYGGSIDTLKRVLVEKLRWALSESASARQDEAAAENGYLDIHVHGISVHPSPLGVSGPTIHCLSGGVTSISVVGKNARPQHSPPASAAYLYCRRDEALSLTGDGTSRQQRIRVTVVPDDEAPDGLSFRYDLGWMIPALPQRCEHSVSLTFSEPMRLYPVVDARYPMRLRLTFMQRDYDYPFVLAP